MKSQHFGIVVILGFCFLASGCWLISQSPSGPEISNGMPEGNASVKMKMIIPHEGPGNPLVSLRASTGVQITFRLIVGHPGNKEHPKDIIVKSAFVDDQGNASVNFSGLPLRPVIAQISISRGNFQGYSDFHGAADLKDGENIIEVAPPGSRLPQDVTAHAVFVTFNSPNLMQSASSGLVEAISTRIRPLDMKSSDIYAEAVNKAIEVVRPAAGIYLACSDDRKSLLGYSNGMKYWEVPTSDLFQTTDLWATSIDAMSIKEILRQAVDNIGYVSWRHDSLSPFAVAAINSSDGTRKAFVKNPGVCDQILVLSDGSVIVGGTNDDKRCPVLFRWSGNENGSTWSNAGGAESGLIWYRYFTDHSSTGNVPNPTVKGIQFDGINTLFVTVDSPEDDSVRTYRISLDNVSDSEQPAAPNAFPTVTLTSPTANSAFQLGQTIPFTATASDSDGSIGKVSFYSGTTLLGEDATAPYTLSADALPAGEHLLTAVSTDDKGACTVSFPVSITVKPSKYESEIDLGAGVKMQLVKITAGNFQMGLADGSSDEQPVRTVSITQSFYIGKYEVTQEQYTKLMGTNPSGFTPADSYADTCKQPVESVSWYDAIRLCNVLSSNQGLNPCYTNQNDSETIADGDTVTCSWSANGYRLPSEAEWEFACRAGTTTRYSWGDTTEESIAKSYSWYAKNADTSAWTPPHADKNGSQPVGAKTANTWGLHDMHGNVSEWCWDWYDTSYYSAGTNTDPRGPTTGSTRIHRGGAWNIESTGLTSTIRHNKLPTGSDSGIGIRVVRSEPTSESTDSPYKGLWYGHFSNQSSGESGIITLNVTESGDFSLICENLSKNASGTANGTVGKLGEISATITYPDKSFAINMTLTLADNIISGTCINPDTSIDLLLLHPYKVTTCKYAGSWTGPFETTVDGVVKHGTGTFVVSNDGSITGTGQNTTINKSWTLSGKMDSIGNYTGQIQYEGEEPYVIHGSFSTILGDHGSMTFYFLLGSDETPGNWTLTRVSDTPPVDSTIITEYSSESGWLNINLAKDGSWTTAATCEEAGHAIQAQIAYDGIGGRAWRFKFSNPGERMTAFYCFNHTSQTWDKLYEETKSVTEKVMTVDVPSACLNSVEPIKFKILSGDNCSFFESEVLKTTSSGPSAVSMDSSEWEKVNTGIWEQTSEGIKVFGAAYRAKHQGIVSKREFDFRGSETRVKWKGNGGSGTYAAFWVFLISDYNLQTGDYSSKACGIFGTTHNVWAGSVLIGADTWYYTRISVQADGSYTAVTSTSNYDDKGGNVIYSGEGIYDSAPRGKILVIFNDNYGGTATYMVTNEVTTSAGPVENTNLPPTVSITAPEFGAIFQTGTTFNVEAAASDPDGSIAKVELIYNDTTVSLTSAPYTFALNAPTEPMPVGNYTLTVRATDNSGATGEATVNISITPLLESITLAPANITVITNGTYNLTNIAITGHYSDSTSKTIATGIWSKKSGTGTLIGTTYTAAAEPYRDVLTCSVTENGITKTADMAVQTTTPESVTIDLGEGMGMGFVVVPAGTFIMGSPTDESGRESIEGPQVQVTLTKAFQMSRFEITQAQWMKIMNSWPGTAPSTGWGLGDDIPVYFVSWYDAINFCNALSESQGLTPCYDVDGTNVTWNTTGTGYRLPTEAEWEYAVRADTTTAFYWGATGDGDYAWTNENAGGLSGEGHTGQVVGGKLPNAYGLYDMTGNVWEWVWDRYDTYAPPGEENPPPKTDPTGPASGNSRLIRGGSWATTWNECRSARRAQTTPDMRNYYWGFRVVRTIPAAGSAPSAPTSFKGLAGDGTVTLSWEDSSGATSYNIYWSASSNVSKTNGTKLSGKTSPFTHTDRENGTVYYYVVTAENAVGESVDSEVKSATPSATAIDLGDGLKMEFLAISSGSFHMGSQPQETGRKDDEGPVHEVTLSKGFYMGKYHVTQSQWLKIMKAWPKSVPTTTYGLGDDYPAYYVSWYDAINFCNALSAAHGLSPCYNVDGTDVTWNETGTGYRLPTEAEWEYAARAGTTTSYYWGGAGDGAYAWMTSNSDYKSHPVGEKSANAFGLFDMSGNLMDYCWDKYSSSYYSSSPATDPRGPDAGTYIVIRGGSWYDSWANCRSAYRGYNSPDGTNTRIGFRLVRTIP